MRRYLAAVIVVAATVMLTAVPALATSNAVLSDGAANPKGTNTPVGATLAASGTVTLSTSSGTNIFPCSTVSFSLTVQDNPTAPGTAIASDTSTSFIGCTNSRKCITVAFSNFDTFSFRSGGTVTISSSMGAVGITCKIETIIGQTIACGYHVHDSSGNITGTYSNSNNTITITNARFGGNSGNSSQCPSPLFLSASLGPVTDSNERVFVN